MIRAILIILGLGVGLALAALAEGRLRHLRAIPGLDLPAWTASLGGDSRAGAGRAADLTLAQGALLADLDWRLRRLGLTGAAYDLRITAPGTEILVVLRKSYARGGAQIVSGSGRIDLGGAFSLPIADLHGVLIVEALSGRVDPPGTRLAASARVEELRLAGTALGDGVLRVEPDIDDGWRAELRIASDVMAFEATAHGRYDSTMADLSIALTEGPAFPMIWQSAMATVASGGKGAWTWDTTVDLGALRRPQ